MARVSYKDLRGYLELLEARGLLRHVTAEVDLVHEVGALSAISLDRRGPGMVLENLKGHPGARLVINIMSTTEQVAVAFNTEEDDVEIVHAIHQGKASPIPPVVVEDAVCQEVVHVGDEVDLSVIPTPIWHEKDAAPYIGTTAGCITADPETGYINSGLYRCMVVDKTHLTMHNRGSHPVGQKPPPGAQGGHADILKWEQLGENAPIAVAIGMDPVATYMAGQGVPSTKVEHAEYAMTGGCRGEPLELVKCRTNDLLVPAWSEYIIEGEVLRDRRTSEGPWGENADIYSSVDDVFLIKVNCITHRRDPINYGLICRPLEDHPKFLMGGGIKAYLMSQLDIVNDVHVFPRSGNRPFAVVAARVRKPGDFERIAEAVAAMPRETFITYMPRWLVVVDDDADIRDSGDIFWRLSLATRPDKDLGVRQVAPARSGSDLEHMIVVDATFRNKPEMEWGPGAGELEDPPVARTSPELRARVLARWEDFGLD
jgi:UbiD family decarboxylase